MACTQRAPRQPPERLATMAPSITPCAGGGAAGAPGAVRVRTVRLSRRAPAPAPAAPSSGSGSGSGLGFSLRGGREHGTGFFVSAVEFGSEAHLHGLKVGDQLLRINGFSLNQATHKEVLQLVSNQNSLTLKVKTVGVLPVKDKSNDPLTWRIVPERVSQLPPPPPPPPHPAESTAEQLRLHLQQQQRQGLGGDLVRMVIQVPHKAKLGCGICRGPDWRPGIFVQFTKEGGPAREAGLRPGDQLLQCNGSPFADIPFAEAVNAMKSASTLDLLVRRSAGCDLFPGESSGYNSSASSVAGGDSPSWDEPLNTPLPAPLHHAPPCSAPAPPGRLATLREGDEQPPHPDWGKVQNGPHVMTTGNLCTVIRLESPDNGWVSGTQDEADTAIRDSERTTVVVQVHRSEVDDDSPRSGPPRAPCAPPAPGLTEAPRLCSSPSSSSLASNSCSASLSSAISQELQRRSEQRQQAQERSGEDAPPTPPPAPAPPAPPPPPKPSPLASVLPADQQKREQHERLMDEFRRAHRKMFAHAIAEANAAGAGAGAGAAAKSFGKGPAPRPDQERERFLQRRQQLEQQHAAQVSAGLALSAARERGLRVERDRQDAQEAEREVTRLVRRNGPRHPPPPLPEPEPEPQIEAEENGIAPPNAPAVVAAAATSTTSTTSANTASSTSVVSAGPAVKSPATAAAPTLVNVVNGVSSAASAFQVKLKPVHHPRGGSSPPPPPRSPAPSPAPPYCPTPDYDSDSSAASAARGQPTKVLLNGPQPEVEMRSLDSLELLEPRAKEPRPPQTYFQNSKTGTRPSVCVTIREYGGTNSRQPSKFSFLNNRQQTAQDSCQEQQEPAACRLQSELASTLSRANIRNRIESNGPENGATHFEAKEPPKPEDVARGSITFTSLNGTSNNMSAKGNLPNGILKKVAVGHLASNGTPVGHGITAAALAGAALHRTKTTGPVAKTITFGAKATIINEKSIPS